MNGIFGPQLAHTFCCRCKVVIWMEPEVMEDLKRTGESFNCINGHAQHFTDSEREISKKTIADLKKQLLNTQESLKRCQNREANLRQENERMAHVIQGLRTWVTRHKKTIANLKLLLRNANKNQNR